MDLYIYSDESGVFDQVHNKFFVFGGLILIGKQERDDCIHRYLSAEACIRPKYNPEDELKASLISNREKSSLFRAMNPYYKFGVTVYEQELRETVFCDKKTRQRYQDFAYKRGLKNALVSLQDQGVIGKSVGNMYIFVDEHTTATNGRYELKEGLEQEFRTGTHNYNFLKFFPPIFDKMGGIHLTFCNSASTTLVRAADIIANKIYHAAEGGDAISRDNLFIQKLP